MTQLSNDPDNAGTGPLMLDLEGPVLTPSDENLLKRKSVGGVILFSRNFVSTNQLQELTRSIRAIKPGLLIAVDHEGGRVQRFREGFTRIPPMARLGEVYQKTPEKGIALARDIAWLLAAELRVYDIDFSFAPVLDRDHGVSEVIGDRAFSSNPETLIALARAFVQGMDEAGMASTGKHFPGHGAVVADSHVDLPVDSRSYEAIKCEDLCVFAALIESGISALMPAHVVYSEVDSAPAGFSSYWMQGVLRKELSFDGVIFSDDLGMAGAHIAGDFIARTKAALSAGCDMVLVCNDPEGALQVAEYLDHQSAGPSARLSRMRGGKRPFENMAALQVTPRWQTTKDSIESLRA